MLTKCHDKTHTSTYMYIRACNEKHVLLLKYRTRRGCNFIVYRVFQKKKYGVANCWYLKNDSIQQCTIFSEIINTTYLNCWWNFNPICQMSLWRWEEWWIKRILDDRETNLSRNVLYHTSMDSHHSYRVHNLTFDVIRV